MKIDFGNFDISRQTVLCLRSYQFERDVEALRQHGTRYNWALLDEKQLAFTQSKWLPERLRQQSRYVNEHGADVDAAWVRAKALGIEILQGLAGLKIAAVMSSHFDYWHDESLRLACTELGIPFLVLMREHELSEERYNIFGDYWGEMERVPEVAGVAVPGEIAVDMWTKVKVHPPSKMRATGWPRLDIWHTKTQPKYDGPIVLLSYYKGYSAGNHFLDMLRVFAEAAKRHPSRTFLVKAKHGDELTFLKKHLAERKLDLIVEDSMNFPSLIGNARAVVGFDSLAMLECLLAPVPIFAPSWGETLDNRPARALSISPEDSVQTRHIHFVQSEVEMNAILDRAATGPVPTLDMASRLAAFQHYFTYDPVQKASERVENFVAEFSGGVGR